MTVSKTQKTSEISFEDNFKLKEKRDYIIWNYKKNKLEKYSVVNEDKSLYILNLEELSNPIFDFYGIWKDMAEEEYSIFMDSIKEFRNKMRNKYIKQ